MPSVSDTCHDPISFAYGRIAAPRGYRYCVRRFAFWEEPPGATAAHSRKRDLASWAGCGLIKAQQSLDRSCDTRTAASFAGKWYAGQTIELSNFFDDRRHSMCIMEIVSGMW